MRKGKTKVRWIPTIALYSTTGIPSTAEATAGTDLSPQLNEINGFTFKNSPIDTPDMSSALVTKVSGEDTLEDSSLVFYEDDTTNPIQTLLAKGTNGYVGFYYKGTAGANPASGDKIEYYPVQVGSNSRRYTAGNEAAMYEVAFTVTNVPKDVTQGA
jgi:hypothetical protein